MLPLKNGRKYLEREIMDKPFMYPITMQQQYKFNFKELPVNQIARDPNQPRRDFGTEGDENRLLISIRKYGIQEPIKVSEIEDEKYVIIDGHRRFICAQNLGMTAIPCRIYPTLSSGVLESLRYEIQNNRRPWRPLERSEAMERIKNDMGFDNNKELAAHLHLSETVIANSLQLRKQKLDYLTLMAKYDLSEGYQVEFVRLKPKIRKIKNLEVDDIIKIIFEKVKHRIIKNSKDFRRLGRVFLRATANEQELHHFLSNPDITISELEQRTTQSGFSLLIEQIMQKFVGKRNSGIAFSSQEKDLLDQLSDLLKKSN